MSIQEPGKQPYDDTGAQANGQASNGHASGGALVPQGTVAPMAMSMAPASPQMDVVKGGMDGSSLFHAFRRRWLLATALGILLGSGAAAGLYWFFEESSSATAMFQVDAEPDTILKPVDEATDFDTFRRTQEAWLKSPYVLNAALSAAVTNPDLGVAQIKDLSIFDGVEEERKVQWLAEELDVFFPQESELLHITLEGAAPPAELEAVVEAVATAYYEEVAFATHRDRMQPVEILRNSERKITEELRRKTDAYFALVKERGTGQDLLTTDPEVLILQTELKDLLEARETAKDEGIEAETIWAYTQQMMSNPTILQSRINDAVQADPTLANLRDQLSQLELAAMTVPPSNSRRGGEENPYQQQIAAVQQQLATYEAQLRQAYADKQEDEPDAQLVAARLQYELKKTSIDARIKEADARITVVSEKLREKSEVNADLELRLAEIESLRQLQRSIAERIQSWSIESGARERVQRIPGVNPLPGINRVQRIAISGIGGLATFVLTCFGVAYLEFRNRKLNGPNQVDEGLGIRVIGTLPPLSGRRQLDPSNPVVAQLTESIDSVRTALMHESTSKRRQVVLVTSAAAMEGRTTVASQLAASLARAGRRTLLIDGDLRRPSLHSLFDVPLEDGLCEVLRAECDVADVVRPTHAEGLWLMTAGYCDADAVHALATDQAQPIFEKLRSEYDFIVIDGAPVLGLADSLLFGQHCDGAILSVLRDYTNLPKIKQSDDLLRGVGVQLIGSVVNGVPCKTDRRVTHLQVTGPKSERKQLEQAGA
ncbi:MAG: polysaccharide biosynthesis tyrosine autokinase [Planctomycetota bacterium]